MGRNRGGRGRGAGAGDAADATPVAVAATQPEQQRAPPAPRSHGRGGHGAAPASAAAAAATRGVSNEYHHKQTAIVPPSNIDTHTFAECPYISAFLKENIKANFGFQNMTRVQHATIPHASEGRDIVAKAQTGTGKTMAFLIPAIDRICAAPLPENARSGPASAHPVSCLILSPTRELTSQIAVEAEGLLASKKAAQPLLNCQMFYGGRPINRDINVIKSTRIDIVVATPGRLLDHLKTTDGFARRFARLSVFVLDEADQMLDMGFRPDLERIMSFLPQPDSRQTMLFSATIPPEIINFAPKVLRRDFTVVSTTKDGPHAEPVHSSPTLANPLESIRDDPLATAALVEQAFCIVPNEQLLAHFVHQVRKEMTGNKDGFKVMAFLPTARQAQLAAELLNAAGIESLEIHSRTSQAKRTKASDTFKAAATGIMCCSDVTARGMDYPNVSLVLQVGLPSDQQQYVHRLGRTARAGRKGRGLLMLTPDEEFFVQLLVNKGKLPVKRLPPAEDVDYASVQRAMSKVDEVTRCQAYQAWLGFFNGCCSKMRWSKEQLVQNANDFALGPLQLRSVPPLMKKTIGMMGLKGVRGLVIDTEAGGGGGRGGRGGGGGGGGGKGSWVAMRQGDGSHDDDRAQHQQRQEQMHQQPQRNDQQQQQQQQRHPQRSDRGGRGGGAQGGDAFSRKYQQQQQQQPQQHFDAQTADLGRGGGRGGGGRGRGRW